ncbi:MAG: helix-turn-helix transcriptional regulator [Chitinispirillaceae bacterium]|nr:helix-turn-helix transcriptional regulator [Chitinispirillaceae bacterium]
MRQRFRYVFNGLYGLNAKKAQAHFAKKLGVSPSMVNSWLTTTGDRQSNPRDDSLIRLRDVFNIDMNFLLNGDVYAGLCQRIKSLMFSRKKKYVEFARDLKADEVEISRIAEGELTPKIEIIEKIVETYRLNRFSLFGSMATGIPPLPSTGDYKKDFDEFSADLKKHREYKQTTENKIENTDDRLSKIEDQLKLCVGELSELKKIVTSKKHLHYLHANTHNPS